MKEHGEYFHIEVSPKSAGDFGGAFMSGIHRTPEDAEGLARTMAEEIKRHVDLVGSVRIVWEKTP